MDSTPPTSAPAPAPTSPRETPPANAPAPAPALTSPGETPPVHLFAGFLLVALVDAVSLVLRIPPRFPFSARLATHFFTAFHVIAMGAAVMGAAMALRRYLPQRPRAGYAVVAVLSAALAYPVLREDLSGPAAMLIEVLPLNAWIALLSVAASQVVPIAAMVGGLLARPWLRIAGVAIGVGLAVASAHNHAQSYLGLHLLATLTAATLIGTSLRGSKLLARLVPRAPRVRIAVFAALALPAAASIVVRPRNAVRGQLAREPAAVLFPYLASGHSTALTAAIPPAQREWFTSRDGLPAIPASAPPLLPYGSLVMLIGIDSLRADVMADEANRAKMPTLFGLKDKSTYFSMARSAGSSTAPSIATMFSGVYYSQLYWTRREGNDPFVYPHEDPTPRFPELLSGAGVRTVVVDGLSWLVNDFAIVRGFTDQRSRRPMIARPMLNEVIRFLDDKSADPMFVFAHILDAHYPYTSAGKMPTPYEGYINELGVIDRELGRLISTLRRQGLWDKTSLVIMADHGEAFGEHGVNTHAQNVYEELIRVPLMIRVPDERGRVVSEPVTLVDIAPTILDLMGVATPGKYMGQSLVGFLRGETPVLRRPIAAEARLKRAMVMPDGFKVITDPIANTVEIFDLNKDPREENNLYVDDSPAFEERLGVLETFFRANAVKKPGYKVPYRRW